VTDPIVVAEGLHKSFGSTHALRGLDLNVPKGTVCGVLGPNGAGKTTAVRILATLSEPDAGHARVAGYDVVREAGEVRERIGLAGQYAAVDEKLTGRGNLRMFGRLSHLPRRRAHQRADELLDRFGLMDAADRPVAGYSGGMRRRLDLITSLILRPKVLFLDEPTTGLDPRSRGEIWDSIRELVADGTTVLLTTQYLEEADLLADRITVIDHGRVIARGSADELKTSIGGDRLTVTLAAGQAAAPALAVLAQIGVGEPAHEAGTEEVSVVVGDGSRTMVEALRRLDDAGVCVVDANVHRPSLDDVFLSLTGKPGSAPAMQPENHDLPEEIMS
jgi:ABC-2 type transport system ATP-binding protein